MLSSGASLTDSSYSEPLLKVVRDFRALPLAQQRPDPLSYRDRYRSHCGAWDLGHILYALGHLLTPL